MKHLIPFTHFRLNESVSSSDETLRILKERLAARFQEHVSDNDLDVADSGDFDWEFEEFIYNELGFSVDGDGMITFHTYDSELDQYLQDLPILLYHYTSSELADAIKQNGLQVGIHQSNPHENSFAGVYLTTEYDGPAVRGYYTNAVNTHGGHPVRVFVKCTMDQLQPDPDDADIKSGDSQFVTDAVGPEDILAIKNLWE